jgi:uncharacterized membrane protein
LFNQRIYAAAEVAVLAVLLAASLWGQIHIGIVGWVIVAAWLFILILPISALLRKHDWKESGIRLDNFLSGLVFVGVTNAASVAVLRHRRNRRSAHFHTQRRRRDRVLLLSNQAAP